MDDSVSGKKLSPPEIDTNESAEQNIDENSFDEYEDKSLKLDFDCMSDAQELGSSAQLEQAFWKSMFPTSSPLSFEKSISQLDQSSIYSKASNTEICAKEVSISEKTANVPSQAALLEMERLINQKMLAFKQEFMSKLETKVSNGMNDVRAVSGSTYWSAGGDESSSKSGIGSYIEEPEIRELAEYRNFIEKTPILRGSLAVKTKRALCENRAQLQDLSDHVAESVEHCNDFAETREKLEAGNESSKKTAQDLDLTLKKQETENESGGYQIESLQMNRSLVEGLHVEKDSHLKETKPPEEELSHLNTAKVELKPAFDQRIKTALFALVVLLLLGSAVFALAWFGVGLELKLTQDNSNGMDHDKVSTQREIENLRNAAESHCNAFAETREKLEACNESSKKTAHDLDVTLNEQETEKQSEGHHIESLQREIEDLRNSLDAEINQRRKTESELKSAQETLEELRRDKAEAEKALTNSKVLAHYGYPSRKMPSKDFANYKASTQREIQNLQNSLASKTKEHSKTESELKLAHGTLEELRRDKASTQREIEELRNTLASKTKEHHKTEGEQAEAENDLTRPAAVHWLYKTLYVLISFALWIVFFFCVFACLGELFRHIQNV